MEFPDLEEVQVYAPAIGSLLIASLATTLGHRFVLWRLHSLPVDVQQKYREPLWDFGHWLLPDLQRYRAVSDVWTLLVQIWMLFVWRVHLASFLVTVSWLYAIRAICFSVTLLPNCRVIPIDSELRHRWITSTDPCGCTWKQLDIAISNFLRLERSLRTGLNHHDLVFSGHMTMTLSIGLHWLDHLSWTAWWSATLLWVLLVAHGIWIIAARNHYTLDVLVSWLLVWNFHGVYAARIDRWVYGDL